MAVIRACKTGGGRKQQAIVRKGGHHVSRVFWRKEDARDWARRVEDAIASATPARPFDRAAWLPQPARDALAEGKDESCPHGGWTIGKALEHYGKTVSVKKKGAAQEQAKAVAVRRAALADIRLDKLTGEDVQGYVDELRAAKLSPSTIRLRYMLLRALYRDAAKLWKVVLPPVAFDEVELPEPPPHRNRRFQDGEDGEPGEEERLRAVIAAKPSASTMLDLLDLAIATGMRQSELLGITAEQFKRVDGVATIEQPDSKTGPRHVVLSSHATAIIKRRAKGKQGGERLFSWTPADLRQRWNAARKEAGLHDFRWHDLRHEGLSRMGAAGMHVGMLMGQSGHKTVATLKRYLNPTPKEVKRLLG